MDTTEFINKINFEKTNGLVPCIVQDAFTKDNLMLAYMNKEALKLTLETNKATFFSRSRNEIWVKGESHGTFLEVIDIRFDCDYDTILLKVKCDPQYNVCHLGYNTCWGKREFSLEYLDDCVKKYNDGRLHSNYTKTLLECGINKCAQKVGEEATEVVIEAVNGTDKNLIYESADLIYHLIVTLTARGLSIHDVIKELERRHKK